MNKKVRFKELRTNVLTAIEKGFRLSREDKRKGSLFLTGFKASIGRQARLGKISQRNSEIMKKKVDFALKSIKF